MQFVIQAYNSGMGWVKTKYGGSSRAEAAQAEIIMLRDDSIWMSGKRTTRIAPSDADLNAKIQMEARKTVNRIAQNSMEIEFADYLQGEVICLERDGTVIQWCKADETPYNSGKTLDLFNIEQLTEAERLRVGLSPRVEAAMAPR